MTKRTCYNGAMDLLANQWLGGLYSLLLLIACFFAVHVFLLARYGYRAKKNLPKDKPERPAPKEPEPVYYIVEKKKKRTRNTYSEPRRISFKDDGK